MQGPIDVLRSLYADPSFAATFSMVAWFVFLLVCGLGYCVARCILGLREENSNEREYEPQRRRSTLFLCRNCARCNMWFRPINYVLEVKIVTSKIFPKRYASEKLKLLSFLDYHVICSLMFSESIFQPYLLLYVCEFNMFILLLMFINYVCYKTIFLIMIIMFVEFLKKLSNHVRK